MQYKYFSVGSADEVEGITTICCSYDDNGNFLGGYRNPEKLYKSKEISKSEFDNINNSPKDSFGTLSDIGKKAAKEKVKSVIAAKQKRLSDNIDEMDKYIKGIIDGNITKEHKDAMIKIIGGR